MAARRSPWGKIAAMSASAASPQETPRDAAVIALAGLAHYTSHVMQLALPPLFPVLHDHFAVSFVDLALVTSFFYVASGLGQAAAGLLVDRYGARRILLSGLVLLSIAVGLMGFVTAYWMLLPLALVAGLGNSVFHPADLSILSHRVSSGRLGRAYATHAVCGTLGFASAPLLVALIAWLAGWRVALGAIGLGGLAVAVLMYANHALLDYRRVAAAPRAGQAEPAHIAYWRIVGSPVVLMGFTYFALTAFAGTGIQTFSITALVSGYGLELRLATLGLTLYLIGGAIGMVAGGFLAERTRQHHRVAMIGISLAAVLMLLVAGLPGPVAVPLMMLAGIASGITAPSRDVLIRAAAAGSGIGSIFGFVYSGFDLGSSVAPLLFGALIDGGSQRAVFLAIACSFALGVPAVMQVRQRAAARLQAPAGAD
jgi:MFS transporter, FSR family, fosmidomycin resistance protein